MKLLHKNKKTTRLISIGDVIRFKNQRNVVTEMTVTDILTTKSKKTGKITQTRLELNGWYLLDPDKIESKIQSMHRGISHEF